MTPQDLPKRAALVGQLIEILRRRIEDGSWPVGSRIPVETELLSEFGVSRITLRQAVQALVHVGMLETIQGSGTFVRAASEVDAVLARYLGGEDFATLLEVRLAIEGESASLAATNADAADLRALDEILDASRDLLDHDDHVPLAALSRRFHRGIVRAAGNAVLLHFYDAIGAGAERSFVELGGPQTPERFLDEHQGILDAIRSGDAEQSLLLARAHVLPVLREHGRPLRKGQGPTTV